MMWSIPLYVDTPTLEALGGQDLSNTVAQAITQRASELPDSHAERDALDQFLDCWNLPAPEWKTHLQSRIDAYLNRVATHLNTPASFFDYVQLSEGRRKQFEMSSHGALKESDLLFPTLLKPFDGVPQPEKLRMTADGMMAVDN
jgi:hypothetical protein